MDKSATILEAQWMEKEIPRIKEELETLKTLEQALLTTPLETVSKAYSDTFRAEQQRAYPFYHRRRRVVPTRHGYRERRVEVGWLSIGFKVLMAILTLFAVYVAYHNHQIERTQRGIIWGSVLLVSGIVLSFAPMFGAYLWQRAARRHAEQAATDARSSSAFLKEKQERQSSLVKCRERIAALEERLKYARIRYDVLRQDLTSGNHRGEPVL